MAIATEDTELRRHLLEQLEFLEASAVAYDAGKEAEAKRLALHIRILVHDTSSSTSLLTHLGVKRSLGFLDTGHADPPPPPVIVIDAGLCTLQLSPGGQPRVRFVPPLGTPNEEREHPPTSFIDWWEWPVLRDSEGSVFSRRDLVLGVCNKDGGAHIDAAVDGKYAALTRGHSIGMTDVAPDGSATPVRNSLALASVRQIAFELTQTIQLGLLPLPDRDEPLSVRQPVCPLSARTPPAAERNDPCPCGSGRKYKQCFGLRRPRRRMAMPDAGEHSAQMCDTGAAEWDDHGDVAAVGLRRPPFG